MKSFLIGLGIGVGLGVLFAPMSGEETRGRLSDNASDLADSARSRMEEGRDRVQRRVSAIRNKVSSRIGGESRPTGTEPLNL